MKKITVLTPTYNDSESIKETLTSLLNQSYTNWESIIIDDGSTDNTKSIIENFKKENNLENKIKYIYQENKDQLNAILNGLNYISGDYIFLLHSDDLLPCNDFFEKLISSIEKYNCDALIGDFQIINENSQVVDCWRALKYRNLKCIPVILLLNQGANFYGDFGLWKKEIYINYIKNNYLSWNTPFWIDLQGTPKVLNVKTVRFPMLKYRVHAENYINNSVGKFNVLNGELRALSILLNYYTIPLYHIQKFIWDLTRVKGIRKLHLGNYFVPFYLNKPTKNRYKIIENKVKSFYGADYSENIFLKSIVSFYKNPSNRTINLSNLKNEEIYLGKDIRTFTNKLFNNELSSFYYNLFNEMQKGFNCIEVDNDDEKVSAINLAKFLCIYPYVKITVKK